MKCVYNMRWVFMCLMYESTYTPCKTKNMCKDISCHVKNVFFLVNILRSISKSNKYLIELCTTSLRFSFSFSFTPPFLAPLWRERFLWLSRVDIKWKCWIFLDFFFPLSLSLSLSSSPVFSMSDSPVLSWMNKISNAKETSSPFCCCCGIFNSTVGSCQSPVKWESVTRNKHESSGKIPSKHQKDTTPKHPQWWWRQWWDIFKNTQKYQVNTTEEKKRK